MPCATAACHILVCLVPQQRSFPCDAVVYFGPTKNGALFAQGACADLKEMEVGYNDAEFLVDLVTGESS